MPIQQILNSKSADVISVAATTTIAAAATRLTVDNIGALVVTDAVGRPLGLFTESDLTRSIADLGAEALDSPVAEAMSPGMAVVDADASIRSVMDIMTRARTRYVVVVNKDLAVGIVSIGDVVKARLDDCQLEKAVLRDHYLIHR